MAQVAPPPHFSQGGGQESLFKHFSRLTTSYHDQNSQPPPAATATGTTTSGGAGCLTNALSFVRSGVGGDEALGSLSQPQGNNGSQPRGVRPARLQIESQPSQEFMLMMG